MTAEPPPGPAESSPQPAGSAPGPAEPPPGGLRRGRPTELRPPFAEFSAGGVVVRGDRVAVIVPVKRGPHGERVLGLPKGHPDGEESAAEAALREVREETGVVAEVIGDLGRVSYRYQRGGRAIAKEVAFFLMRYVSGDLADHDHEVASARWMPFEQAVEMLTFDGEREMVRRALSRIAPER